MIHMWYDDIIWYDDVIWYAMLYDTKRYMIWYMIWYGMVWYDMIWYDIWNDIIRYDMIYDMRWYMILYHMIWYHMIWYHMIWYHMEGWVQNATQMVWHFKIYCTIRHWMVCFNIWLFGIYNDINIEDAAQCDHCVVRLLTCLQRMTPEKTRHERVTKIKLNATDYLVWKVTVVHLVSIVPPFHAHPHHYCVHQLVCLIRIDYLWYRDSCLSQLQYCVWKHLGFVIALRIKPWLRYL